MSKNVGFTNVEVDASNFDEVERLMKQQAQHHNVPYNVDKQKTLDALSGQHPLIKSILIYPTGWTDAACCVMYHPQWTLDGKSTYIEDICTDINYRGGGIGTYTVDAVAKASLLDGANIIIGSVAKNNTHTMKFWNKNLGFEQPRRSYDLTCIFNDQSKLNGITRYHAQELSAPHIALPAYLQGATTDPTSRVIAVYDGCGDIATTAILNLKFDAISGDDPTIAIEPLRFHQWTSKDEKIEMTKLVLREACDLALANNYKSHIMTYTDISCDVSNDFMVAVGGKERWHGATDDTRLVCMQMPCRPSTNINEKFIITQCPKPGPHMP
ncbi:MAG: GNAT family N-acetyltransferase [Pseudomonadota bacterium]|jgi:ribosomal protein S18 acetylase RimI-like enzyme|nr:hypothetical protein [Alphaproteobacteria bacterium]MCS5596770.1 GNAT family N-acetyltransferase [Alphaproteobacteria bacterium]MEC7702999.1 GNAT family N-acetyltransferase [Pseudomonadota bacterium]MEC9235831.1 GNAT family N-acetyltransferase [Pseudomonadota bacterium]|tara:strand:- start:54033 stop:55010 length:978 start_codon:yes stop_codon:yes gene_type:complete